MRFKSQYVELMPKELAPGILYISKEFGTAAHLCACGCGAKIRTPLGPTEWSVTEDSNGPSVWPSIGNWQRPCRSHYVIEDGEVMWAGAWSERQIKAGRKEEERRRQLYFEGKRGSKLGRLWRKLKHFFDTDS